MLELTDFDTRTRLWHFLVQKLKCLLSAVSRCAVLIESEDVTRWTGDFAASCWKIAYFKFYLTCSFYYRAICYTECGDAMASQLSVRPSVRLSVTIFRVRWKWRTGKCTTIRPNAQMSEVENGGPKNKGPENGRPGNAEPATWVGNAGPNK